MLPNWRYYKEIAITNPNSVTLTNYQVKIELDSGNFDFNKTNSDGSDIRFFDSDNRTSLSFWIESWNNSEQITTVWVKVNIGANSSKTIRIYFGNVNAVNESNIANTAINGLGDDFEEASLNINKWTAIKKGSANATVELDGSGNLHLAGEPDVISSGSIVSKNTITNGIIIKTRVKYTSDYYVDITIGNGVLQDLNNGGQSEWWHTCQGNGYSYILQSLTYHIVYKAPSGTAGVGLAYSDNSCGATNTFEINEFVYDSSGNLKYILNGTQLFSATDTDYLSSNKHIGLHQGEYSNGDGGSSYYDWIFVHQYTDLEPTTSVGSIRSNTNALFFSSNF